MPFSFRLCLVTGRQLPVLVQLTSAEASLYAQFMQDAPVSRC